MDFMEFLQQRLMSEGDELPINDSHLGSFERDGFPEGMNHMMIPTSPLLNRFDRDRCYIREITHKTFVNAPRCGRRAVATIHLTDDRTARACLEHAIQAEHPDALGHIISVEWDEDQ